MFLGLRLLEPSFRGCYELLWLYGLCEVVGVVGLGFWCNGLGWFVLGCAGESVGCVACGGL